MLFCFIVINNIYIIFYFFNLHDYFKVILNFNKDILIYICINNLQNSEPSDF